MEGGGNSLVFDVGCSMFDVFHSRMITFLQGKLIEALPTQVVVDVNGVGYEALIPLSSFDKLPQPGETVKLLTQLVIREDAHMLYGFMTAAERDLFRLLVNSVSGIGPKTALNILSGISVTAFRGAVAGGDVKALSQISGVGKKTAERIIVELRDKIGAAGGWEAASAQRALSPEDQKLNDAMLALMALGFKQIDAHDAVRAAQSDARREGNGRRPGARVPEKRSVMAEASPTPEKTGRRKEKKIRRDCAAQGEVASTSRGGSDLPFHSRGDRDHPVSTG